METTATKRGNDDVGIEITTTTTHTTVVTGRTVPLAMGSVRLGGAGRPVAISSNHSSSAFHGNNRDGDLRPRVVLEPQPRSPFGRKLESSVTLSLASQVGTEPQPRFQVQKTTLVAAERIHATHHPTRRTPVATALRQVEATASSPPPPTVTHGGVLTVRHAASVEIPRRATRSPTEEDKSAMVRKPQAVRKAKSNESDREPAKRSERSISSTATATSTTTAANDGVETLRPEKMAAFVRKPTPAVESEHSSHIQRFGFHEHERLSIHQSPKKGAHDNEPQSGWRAVDESIDYIYEDPSIDVVQLQLLLHGNRVGGVKRKAVERERLQVAAAEVHKQQQGLSSKMDELQRRKDQISKLSEDIRRRNMSTMKKNVASTTKKAKRVESTPAELTRKPPVPRLSQLGGKPHTSGKRTKKSVVVKANDDLQPARPASALDEFENENAGDRSDVEAEAVDRHETSASDSILLGTSGAADKITTTKAPKTRKKTSKRPASESERKLRAHPPQSQSSGPPPEQLQRREVAREYMQLQKQARHLLKMRLDEEKRLAEERRRLELQRIEQVRLRELEEARKRRIKQKQRDRIAQKKLEQQQLHRKTDDDFALASPAKPNEFEKQVDADVENQSFRGNDPRRKTRGVGGDDDFEWPDHDHASSSSSSPRQFVKLEEGNDSHVDSPVPPDPKLQKLLLLEEKTKLLTARLQSLAQRGGGGPTRHVSSSSKATEENGIQRETEGDHAQQPNQGVECEREDETEGEREEEDEDGDGDEDEDEEDHGSETRVVEESDEEDDEEAEEGRDTYHTTTTRIDRERFAFFETGNPHGGTDEVDEFDLSSIGVQKIQVVWPREDLDLDGKSESDGEAQPSSRFEELSSSSSSSASAKPSPARQDQLRSWQSAGSDDDDDDGGGYRSPKLLEDSVDAYAQRLLEQTARIQGTSADNVDLRSYVSPPPSNPRVSSTIKTSHWLRAETSPAKKRHVAERCSSDAELLRLIRESDDNMSVIDREAKRRFRIQQERMRKRRDEQERVDEEALIRRLTTKTTSDAVVDTPTTKTAQDEKPSDAIPTEASERADLGRIVKLEDILKAVQDERALDTVHHDIATPREADADRAAFESENPFVTAPPAVAFWNSQLRSSTTAPSAAEAPINARQRPPRIEIDRSDLRAQRQRQFELEDDEEADESERLRVVSPQTLSKRLLAAVDYHDAIHEAHLQLSMMEKAHALEQVQQDTIALAQAFKDEMDSTLLAQQLVDEHAALANKFDDDLQHVVDQLEAVREAERDDHKRELEQVAHEARMARNRESSVQTEPMRVADAATSAQLHVDVAMGTERECADAAVQYVDVCDVRAATTTTTTMATDHEMRSSASSSPKAALSQDAEDVGEYTEDYAEETFDRASISSPAKTIQSNGGNGSVSMEDAFANDRSAAVVVEEEPGESIESDVDSEHDEDVRSDPQEEEEEDDYSDIASESATSKRDDHGDVDDQTSVRSSVEENNEMESAAASSARGAEQSASVRYDESDFEDETSVAPVAMEISASHSEVEDDEEDESHETDDAVVSSEVEDEQDQDDDGSENYSSMSYEQDEATKLPTPTTAGARSVAIPPRMSAVQTTASPFPFEPMQLSGISAANLPTDVAQAYIAQLENRKQSEQALLEIRLHALQHKLQEDTRSVIEAIDLAQRKPQSLETKSTLKQLVARREALQIGFLSEQANLESQRSACVSRYYQDLLAFQSLGMAAIGASMYRPPEPIASVTMAEKVPAAASGPNQPPLDKEGRSAESAYSEDEFASNADDQDDAVASARDSAMDEDQVSAASQVDDDVEEDDEEIQSAVSSEHSEIDSDEARSPPSETDDHDNYGDDDDFASVSESAHAVENVVVVVADDEASVASSSPSIADEASSSHAHSAGSAVSDDAADGDDDGDKSGEEYEDEFASVSESASVQDDRRGSISEDAVEDDPSVAAGASSVAPAVSDDEASIQADGESHDAPSEAAYSEDAFDGSVLLAQEESSTVMASQSDNSSTTKLLVAEVAALQIQIKDHESNNKHGSKMEKKKMKAQELLHAKEQLIKQQLEQYRQNEERVQVDAIAEMALGLDVHAEVDKGKAAVRGKLEREFEALKQAYPQLAPTAGVALPPKQTHTVPAIPRPNDGPAQVDTSARYSDEYDDYEVESFEKEGSVASETDAQKVPSTLRSATNDEEDGDDPEVGEDVRGVVDPDSDGSDAGEISDDTANSDIASETEQISEDKSVADDDDDDGGDGEMDDDAYDDDTFDQTAAVSDGDGDGGEHGEIDASSDQHDTAHDSIISSHDRGTQEPTIDGGNGADEQEKEEEEDEYSDEEFEQSMSRQPSMSSHLDGHVEQVVATELVAAREDEVTTPEDAEDSADGGMTRMATELQAVATATATAAAGIAVDHQEPSAAMLSPTNVAATSMVLSESLSASHADDESFTASMDEQTKRIHDLKHKIELRKLEFAAVQKQLRIEKKKEHLRDAESKLWLEMEQLETQLVADERILALTRQRGRLETLALEARHTMSTNDPHRLDREDMDLLAEYDFVEGVEAVRSPVVKQDHQAQVRLEYFQTPTLPVPSEILLLSHQRDTCETDVVDFLLAYDYVEPAERPVTTVSTSTESIGTTSTHDAFVVPVEASGFKKSDEEASADFGPVDVPPQPQVDLAGHDQGGDTLSVDLLAQYDVVEIAEAVDERLSDLLNGYDHVESVESPVAHESADSRVEDAVDTTSDLGIRPDQDEDEQSESMSVESESVQSDDVQLDDQGEDHGDTGMFDAVGLDTKEDEEVQQVIQDDESLSDEDCQARTDDSVDGDADADAEVHERVPVPEGRDATIDVEDVSDEMMRVSDLVLARLLQEAVTDVHRAANRKAERERAVRAERVDKTLEEVTTVELVREPPQPPQEICFSAVVPPPTAVDLQVEKDKEKPAIGPVHHDDYAVDQITDRLFQALTGAAVHESVRIQLKKSTALSTAGYELVDPKATQLQAAGRSEWKTTDRDTARSLAEQLRLSSDSNTVSLPDLYDCVGVPRDDRTTTRAIYDAVLESACIAHKRLVHDPHFQQRGDDRDPKQQRMLVDYVQLQMEERVWKHHDATCEELDRFARKAQEDEQGELDQHDLRLLLAQQRTGSAALADHFQSVMTHDHGSSAASTVATPRLRKRQGSLSRSACGSTSKPGLASQILQQEEDRLADSITERLMNELLNEELLPTLQQKRR